jgi:hypothetical protein
MRSERAEREIERLQPAITAAAVAFEQRWTLAALRRVDAGLHARLLRQHALWTAALAGDDVVEVVAQGEAMVRGWRAAVAAMIAEGEQDCACLVGRDTASGLVLAIGTSLAAADQVRQSVGPDAVFLTPDEVAGLLAGLGGFETLAAIKRAFPGATASAVSPSI